MAELATIARPYAEALHQASQSMGDGIPQQWGQMVSALAAQATDPALLGLVANPKVSPDESFGVMAHVVEASTGLTLSHPSAQGVSNLLKAVIENHRVAALPEIAAQFHALANAGSGVSDATVYSAYPIDDTRLRDVQATLERRFGRRLVPNVVVDPSLIGGIRVVVGDEVLDTSIQGQLERMKVALTA